jgi:TolB-like protein
VFSSAAAADLPGGPSIAVLPFSNLSGDSAQDLFAEALRGDIVTGLTQSSHLFVLTADSTAGYAGGDAEDELVAIGAKLGVMYLLRGSVRKSGDALRVSAQLMNAANGVQLWSMNYDRELDAEALFAVQDDIRERIVASLSDLHGVIYSTQGMYSAVRQSAPQPEQATSRSLDKVQNLTNLTLNSGTSSSGLNPEPINTRQASCLTGAGPQWKKIVCIYGEVR